MAVSRRYPTCSVGVEVIGAGLAGGGVGEEEARVTGRAGGQLARGGKSDSSRDRLTADLWLHPLVHNLGLNRGNHQPLFFYFSLFRTV